MSASAISQLIGNFAGDASRSQKKSKHSSSGGDSKTGMNKTAAYIFSSLIVPYLFSKIIRPLRFRMRIWLAKKYKRALRREGKRSMKTKGYRFALQHLDTYTSKESLFAFYLALIVFLKTILPHFQTALRTLVRRFRT